MRRIGVAIAVVMALGVSACAGSSKSSSTTAPSVKPGAPDGPGPYAVGRRTLQMVDPARKNRTLAVDVWYPADGSAAAKAVSSKYVFVPGIEYSSKVAKDGPAVAAGKFPLVVYSHGSSGIRFVSTFLTESLASHGFVVVAPDHKGNTAIDVLLGAGVDETTTKQDRVADVGLVITQMLAPGNDNAFRGSVDAQRVGVIGHSLGGFTALMSAAGWATTAPDARVRAVVGMAPYTRTVPDAALAKVDVPTMLITGTKDTITPIDNDTSRPWNIVPGRPLYRVDVLDAGHQSFTDVCFYKELLPTLSNVPPQFTQFVDANAAQACAPGLLDIAQAHREINGYVTAFLQAYVAGDDAAAQYLVSHPPLTTVQVKR